VLTESSLFSTSGEHGIIEDPQPAAHVHRAALDRLADQELVSVGDAYFASQLLVEGVIQQG
jgi:hypothetical protein